MGKKGFGWLNSVFGCRFITTYLTILVWFSGCQFWTGNQKPIEFVGFALGTSYSIKISGLSKEEQSHKIHQEIKKILAEVEKTMSVFEPNSEISKFNQSAKTDWFEISPELLAVISESDRISRLSDGAFDITLGGIIELWGFGGSQQNREIPTSDKINKILKNVNFQEISIREKPPAIRKKNPNIMLNLSAIAKGYAVDRVAAYLKRSNPRGYLVEIGGEIRTGGWKNNQTPWIVAIERPEVMQRQIQKVITMQDNGMATSGDYRNYFEIDGKRFSHTIDPNTGWPVDHDLVSVTVIHPSCMTADAFSTAIMVLGHEKGYRLAEKMGLPVFLMIRKAGKLEEKMTPEFIRFLHSAAEQ